MNNYCTNCGEKIEKNELVCKKCNTPIIDLSEYYENNLKNKQSKKIYIIVIILVIFIIVVYFVFLGIKLFKPKSLEKKYIKPYVEGKYHLSEYTTNLEYFGECLYDYCHDEEINCGCGTACCNDLYIKKGCKSYIYKIVSDDKEFFVTVFYYKNKYHVIDGKEVKDYIEIEGR